MRSIRNSTRKIIQGPEWKPILDNKVISYEQYKTRIGRQILKEKENQDIEIHWRWQNIISNIDIMDNIKTMNPKYYPKRLAEFSWNLSSNKTYKEYEKLFESKEYK